MRHPSDSASQRVSGRRRRRRQSVREWPNFLHFLCQVINDLNFRLYADNVFVRSTDRMERVMLGFLFSYDFLPKSRIYLAVNEVRNRADECDGGGNILPPVCTLPTGQQC
ncbi:hypothetical protein FBQ87_00800 [Sphingobacteriales bacterium CHB3]|nr:hypothetical protein [Sphingobacteriales bacterium CHB3]